MKFNTSKRSKNVQLVYDIFYDFQTSNDPEIKKKIKYALEAFKMVSASFKSFQQYNFSSANIFQNF